MKRLLLLALCVIIIAGCGGGGGGGGSSHSSGDVQVVNLPTYDLVYDSANQTVYASVPNTGGTYSNTVAAIDPVSGMVTGSVFVGSNPTKLALSSDGQVLYAAVDAAVRKMNPITMTAGPKYSVGSDGFEGPYYAIDLAVSPGEPGTIAVVRGSPSSSAAAGVAIYDDGVQRPNVAGSWYDVSVIAFSSESTLLFGYNNLTTGFDFSKIAVTSGGAEITDTLGNLISGFAVDMKYDNGLVYASSGHVVEPNSMTLEGRFPVYGLVEPDSANGRVYFLTQDSSSGAYTLRAFNSQTFVQVSSLAIGTLSGDPRSLIRWGADGLAVGTSNKVYLVHTTSLH
jgi:trimeric autotransporter adhesin